MPMPRVNAALDKSVTAGETAIQQTWKADPGRITSTRKRILDQIAWAGPVDHVTHKVIDEAITYCMNEAFKAGRMQPLVSREIEIGRYRLMIMDVPKGNVCITRNGEGGAFDITHFEEAMDTMFEDRL